MIVARDVDVPAFTDSGQRDVLSLRAGTQFREFRRFDQGRMICTASFGGRKMSYVVPVEALEIRAEEPEEFTSIEDYYERMGLTEEGSPEEVSALPRMITDEPVGVDPSVIQHILTYPTPGTTTMPAGAIGKGMVGETKIEYLDPLKRFLFVRKPFLMHPRGIGPQYVTTDPDTGTILKAPRNVSGYEGVIQHHGLFYFYVWMNVLIDTTRFTVMRARDRADAVRVMNEVVESERSVSEGEVVEYRNFTLRRTTDPGTGLFAYEVSVPGSPPLHVEDPLPTLDEARRYVDRHVEDLIRQAAPYWVQ